MASTSQILCDVITGRDQIRGYYDNLYRETCPHAIGWKDGVLLPMQQHQALVLGLSFNLYRLKHRNHFSGTSTEPNGS